MHADYNNGCKTDVNSVSVARTLNFVLQTSSNFWRINNNNNNNKILYVLHHTQVYETCTGRVDIILYCVHIGLRYTSDLETERFVSRLLLHILHTLGGGEGCIIQSTRNNKNLVSGLYDRFNT